MKTQSCWNTIKAAEMVWWFVGPVMPSSFKPSIKKTPSPTQLNRKQCLQTLGISHQEADKSKQVHIGAELNLTAILLLGKQTIWPKGSGETSPIFKAKLNCKQKSIPKKSFENWWKPMTWPVTAGDIMCFAWCLCSWGSLWLVALRYYVNTLAKDTLAPLSQPNQESWGGRSQPVPCPPGPPGEVGYKLRAVLQAWTPKKIPENVYV